MSFANSEPLEQIPARMINEYAYCPRLYYLEHVQQEWAHSADTLDGRFVHRRVDREEGRVPAAADLAEQVKLHSRSVMVGSDRLGAVARIDLIEMAEGRVVPVDYKRGAAPDLPEGAWEPERVQVCLQGLLLRENGYECEYGVLYFAASQSRVTVEFTGELIARTLELLTEARRTAESGVIPPPLVDSPKCPRCSLVGICLPDEINLLTGRHGDGETRGQGDRETRGQGDKGTGGQGDRGTRRQGDKEMSSNHDMPPFSPSPCPLVSPSLPIVIIGGGFAGLAAGVDLA
ncbi:MAG: CRISPR-associated protein Cas4, partial [Blastocatellia bacterium]